MITNPNLIPLSKGQQAIWYLDQLESNSAHYNIAVAVSLAPKIDVSLLEQTFNILIARHEALRTLLVLREGQVFQSALPSAILKIKQYDAVNIETAQIIKTLKKQSLQRFDLLKEIPLRISIHQQANASIMFFCIHHLFADFWSIALIMDEFPVIYSALEKGQELTLEPVSLTFSEYCTDSLAWLSSSSAQNARAYWLDKLPANIPELCLSRESTALNNQDRQGRHLKLKLTKQLTDKVMQQAQDFNCTHFSVLLAYYFKVLNWISGQPDIIVGIPVLGRSKATEKLTVGYLVNGLPVYCNNIAIKSIKQLAQQIHIDVRQLLAKQRYPFAEIAKQYADKRRLDATPVFQTMFTYQRGQKDVSDYLAAITVEDDSVSFSKAGLSIRSFPFEPEIAQFELSMVVALVSDQFAIDLQYDSQRINANKARAVGAYFEQLIDGGEGSDNTLSPIAEPAYAFFGTVIVDNINQKPHNIALRQYQHSLNYREFGQYCRLWMQLINAQGFTPGDAVVVRLTQGFEQISATIAIMLMGGFVAQLDRNLPEKRRQYCIDKCQAKIVIGEEKITDDGNYQSITLAEFKQYWQCFEKQETFPDSLINNDTGGVLMFTSGSTGQPFCAVLSQKNLSYFTQAAIKIYQSCTEDVVLQFTSPGFDVFYEEVLPALASGATLVPKTMDLTSDGEQFEYFLAHHQISFVHLPTAFWHAWVTQMPGNKNLPLPALSRINVGGEVMSPDKLKIWQTYMPDTIQLLNTYGPSEATVTSTWHEVKQTDCGTIPIGKALPGTQLMILDEKQSAVALGQVGELYIASPGLASGYLNDAVATAARFVALPGVDGVWFASGDQVYQDSQNIFHYQGRKDSQIKRHGVRIDLNEVEQQLCLHEQVSNAVIIFKNERLIAFIESDREIARSEWVTALSKHLLKEMIPSEFRYLSALPKTSGGKVDRHRLREQLSPKPAPAAIALMSDPQLEKKLEVLLSQWLAIELDSNVSFFEQGMDSLSAVAIAGNLSEQLGLKVPVRLLFEHSTLKSLSVAITTLKSTQEIPPVTMGYTDNQQVPLTSSQERLLFITQISNSNTTAFINIGFRLTGLIDSLKFYQDWNRVINSHDALKLNFSDQQPMFQSLDTSIHHELNYITRIDALTLDPIEVTLNQVFDADPASYFNSALIKIKPTQHLFLLRIHPLVCDIASLEILLHSFQQRYNSSAQLADTPSSYVQYAKSVTTRPSCLPYWTTYLKDCHAAPQLAIKNTQGQASLQIKSVRNCLGKEATQQLKAFAAEHQLTSAAILFSGYYAVLAKNTLDTTKFVIGTAVSHRAFGDHRNTVGAFTNFALLAGQADDNGSFLQRLKNNQQGLMDAIEHQMIDLKQLLSLLPKSGTSFPVECLFLYQSAPEQNLSLSGVQATRLSENNNAMPALLCLEVTAHEHDFELVMHYDTGYYDASSINSLLASIKMLLAQGLRNSHLSMSELKVMPAELQKLCQGEVVEWQEKQPLLHTLFTTTARKHPLRTAIVNQNLKITYGRLYRQSTRIARVIFSYRKPQTPLYVGILMDKNWQQIAAALGVLRGGGIYAPINVNLNETQVTDLLNNTQIRLVITTTLYKKLYQWPAHVKVLTLDDAAIRHASLIPLRKRKVAVKPTDPAYIIFTSGTTGQPKGVVISHQSALNTIFDINHRIKLSAKDRVFGLSNFTFDLSVYDIFGTFSQGAQLILPDHERLLEPSHWEALTIKHKVSVWNSVPALYRLMVDHISSPVDSLRTVLLSGDWITLDLPALSLNKFPAAQIISLGGATEVSIWSVAYPIDKVLPEWNSIPYGLPLSNQSCYVLDSQLNICPPDVAGELYIGGVGVALEYHQNQQASEQAFVHIESVGERLYKTGDAACLSSKGYFNILGRLDNRIKIAGQFVDLSEIEHVLEGLDTISQCAVVGWSNEGASQQLVAFMQHPDRLTKTSVTDRETLKTLASQVRHLLEENLPRHMLPSKLAFLNTLPLTTNGKIDRSSLEQYQGEFISFQTGGKRPESALQKTLANIWQTLLKCDDICINDNFFELGGDSLMVVGMLSMIEQQLSIVIPIQTVLLYQTIEQLTPVITALISNQVETEHKPSMLDSLLEGELPEILQQEVHLDASIRHHAAGTEYNIVCDHLLLTGSTGYLGSRLLLEILETTRAEVYCLVRSTVSHSGLDRILAQISKIKAITAEQEARIIAIEGDLAKPLLGLTQQDYHLLAKQIDQILHCGAQVNFLLPRDNLKAINVNGSIELLRLASLHKIKQFNYISTVSVFPTIARDLQKTFYEQDSIDQPLAIVGGYPQSKWIAEKVIQLAKERGMPVNIFRPGVIFGDTRIQDLPKEVLLVDFLKVCIDLQAVPNMEILIDITPVDYVAASVVKIFQSSSNTTYHLTNPQAIPFSDFVDLLIKNGIKLRKVNPTAWVKLLDVIDNTRASEGIKILLSMFKDIEQSGVIIFGRNLQYFDCTNTRQALQDTDIQCPAIDMSLIKHFYDELIGIPK